MAPLIARFSLALVMMTVLAVALPGLYDLAFGVETARTQLFYSPTRETFVYREHHGDHDFVYADREGNAFDRRTFEQSIPFIYYKNMEIWGLLPLTIDGKSYTKATIRNNRQVFELKPAEIRDRRSEIAVYPLLESAPEQAGLRFPEDVFRLTADRIEFLNVDTNAIDETLTARFTTALQAEGFSFPARFAAGKPTILKPFDEGYFLVDATGAVFHLKRVHNQPEVVRTPIPTTLGVRDILVTENKKRRFYGLLLAEDGRLFLIATENYRLVPLPVDGYDPDHMDYKLLLNPVQATAVYGNDAVVHAVAMTLDFEPIDTYRRAVPGRHGMLHDRIARVLFPFVLTLDEHDSLTLSWRLEHHGWAGLLGTLAALLAFLGIARLRGTDLRLEWPAGLLVLVGGVFGLAAAQLVPPRRGAFD